MAGQPVKRKIIAELERLAALQSTPEEPFSALDYIHDYIAAGQTMRELAYDLGKTMAVTVSPGVISTWVYSTPGGQAMITQARAMAAHAFAEEAKEIVDDADEEKTALLKARLRAENRMLLASKWNRKEYGNDAPQVAVNVDFGQLHIDALRSRNFVEAKPTPMLPAPEGADYEIVPAKEPTP